MAKSNTNSNTAIPQRLNHPGPQSRATPPVQEGNQEKLPSWTGGVAAASADGVVDVDAEYTTQRYIMLAAIARVALSNPQRLNHPGSQSRATPPVQEGNQEKLPYWTGGGGSRFG